MLQERVPGRKVRTLSWDKKMIPLPEVSDSKVQSKEETKGRNWEAVVKSPVGRN